MEPVLVVGAGPTGLVMALGLARRGIPVRIIDRKIGPTRESRALGVHARTLEFYRQFGFADDIVDLGIKADVVHLRNQDGEVAQVTLGDMGAGLSPYPFLLCFAQDEHERFLLERLAEVGLEVEWQTELTGFVDEADHVVADTVCPTGNRRSAHPYLVGCDGAHSTVRKSAGIDFPGGSFEQLFFVADAVIDGLHRHELYANLDDDGITLMFPVRSTETYRLVGLADPHPTRGERVAWEDVRSRTESSLGIHVRSINWFSTYRVHHRVATRFGRGRWFLAGDAAHVHSPAGAQGMNTGIGDAMNLSWKLAEVLHGRASPALLATYEQERLPFARSLVDTTDRAFGAMIDESAVLRWIRRRCLPHALAIATRFATVRRWLFSRVSQTRISYRCCPFNQGVAGRIHGGDRLPWITEPIGDNFSPLLSLAWQVHVYGAVTPALDDAAARLSLPFHHFDWSPAAAKAGFRKGAAYLVRPDGHVALAIRNADPRPLVGFIRRWDLQFVAPVLREPITRVCDGEQTAWLS